MKVIQINAPYLKCSRCRNLIEWNKDDVEHKDTYLCGIHISTDDVITCPVCGQVNLLKL